ncbi:MAG: ankyrin repeat domain-containing protein, partial [Clostridia bacterium]|nr:ankyrin repeat domain-containing protein [Clostridia bacterium]
MNKKTLSKVAAVLSLATLITSASGTLSQTSAYYNNYNTQTVVTYSDLFTAIENNNLENVRKFINTSNVNATNYYGETPLMRTYNNEIAETILSFAQKTGKLKKVLNAKDFDGKTALMKKIENNYNNAKDVKELIIKYASENNELKNVLITKDNNDKSVLMYLASKNDTVNIDITMSSAKEIKKDKEILNQVDKNGYTALMYAVNSNCLEATKVLIEYGADINLTKTADGTNALKIATDKNNLNIFKFLVEHGAKINLEVNEKQKAIDKISWETLKSAITSKNFDIISLILEKDASKEKFTNEFLEKIKNKDEQALETLKCHCDFAL